VERHCIYGFSKSHKKFLTCDLISKLHQTNNNEKWLVFGDLNLIFNSNEKQGGRDTPQNLINHAYNTLNNCNLVNLGFKGNPFTWTNNQEDTDHIKERLDRFCANPSWITSFPRFTNYHLLSYSSDHNPILLVFGSNNDFREDSKDKTQIKRFENI
jgi:hypothetical protein